MFFGAVAAIAGGVWAVPKWNDQDACERSNALRRVQGRLDLETCGAPVAAWVIAGVGLLLLVVGLAALRPKAGAAPTGDPGWGPPAS